MLRTLHTLGWLACIVYSTIPAFWLMIHPRVEYWRSLRRSPYHVLVPLWLTTWIATGLITLRWRRFTLYQETWTWIPALALFALGFWLYRESGVSFSQQQLYGLAELNIPNSEQRLVTTGIRARVRHPVYLAHLCEMLAWSVGTGLAVCYGLTAFAAVTGAVMIRMEDAELAERFGEPFLAYKKSVPAVLPKIQGKAADTSARHSSPVSLGVVLFALLFGAATLYAYLRRAEPMLFQHGTPEVPSRRAFAVMNPFRDRSPERTAEELIALLHSKSCNQVVTGLSTDERVCSTLAIDGSAYLVYRKDADGGQVLVYELWKTNSRLWLALGQHENGLRVEQVSIIR